MTRWRPTASARRPASTWKARPPATAALDRVEAHQAYKRPEQKRWYAGETISLGIGQGYNNFTMLQLASATATLVAGGSKYEAAHGARDRGRRHRETRARHSQSPGRRTAQARCRCHQARDVRRDAVRHRRPGLCRRGLHASGGKTGTAQAVTIRQNEKYNASRLASTSATTSLYTAFAPLDEPRIPAGDRRRRTPASALRPLRRSRRVLDYVIAGRYPRPEDIALVQKGQGRRSAPSSRWAKTPLPPARTGAWRATACGGGPPAAANQHAAPDRPTRGANRPRRPRCSAGGCPDAIRSSAFRRRAHRPLAEGLVP